MAALPNGSNPRRVRFFDWLISEINSGQYEGLHWVDEDHTTFRIPWKHNSTKNLVESDYKIFKAWAVFSKKYNKSERDLSKWKTNFRNAMKSTRRFEKVESSDPSSDYRIFRIMPHHPDNTSTVNLSPDARSSSNTENGWLPISERHPVFQDFALLQQDLDASLKNLSLENPVPVATEGTAQNFYQCSSDLLHCAMQEANLGGIQQASWTPIPGEAAYVSNACIVPQINPHSVLSLANAIEDIPVPNNYYDTSRWIPENMLEADSQSGVILQHAQQNSPPGQNQVNNMEVLGNDDHFIENVFMNDEPQGNGLTNNITRDHCHLPTSEYTMMDQDVSSMVEQPLPSTVAPQNNANPQTLVSIYYRGKLFLETSVEIKNSCVFTYDAPCQVPGNPQIIQFPSPENLPDQKQVMSTLILLQRAGLLLFEKNNKIYARRLGGSKVFWAFSKELDNVTQNHDPKMLPRDVDTEIFSYEKFLQELRIFHDTKKGPSPDYTIYLCFGQSLPSVKPKEKKLILVKLVPLFCKEYHECVQRQGASSLNSESLSLQLSNSLLNMLDDYLNTYSV